jgi:cysteinyl-tRNA synthetase
MKYLGKTIDIHGGGIENQFPHHECEIAQAEAANGVQFVRYWVHHNMVTVDAQKMGKSLNNFITLKQAFSGAHERLTRSYEPLAVRQLILNSHYRSPLDFSDAALFAAQSGYKKISDTVKAVRKKMSAAGEGKADEKITEELKQLKEKFEAAMNDDLNTSIALSVVFELVRLADGLLGDGDTTAETLNAVDDLFRKLGGDVLGIVKDRYDQITLAEFLNDFIKRRNEARKNKNFELADATRADLDRVGIVLEDNADGTTTWRRK